MKKTIVFLIITALILTGCGSKIPLSTKRAEKILRDAGYEEIFRTDRTMNLQANDLMVDYHIFSDEESMEQYLKSSSAWSRLGQTVIDQEDFKRFDLSDDTGYKVLAVNDHCALILAVAEKNEKIDELIKAFKMNPQQD